MFPEEGENLFFTLFLILLLTFLILIFLLFLLRLDFFYVMAIVCIGILFIAVLFEIFDKLFYKS